MSRETTYLKLPLPWASHTLDQDLPRLQQALRLLDAFAEVCVEKDSRLESQIESQAEAFSQLMDGETGGLLEQLEVLSWEFNNTLSELAVQLRGELTDAVDTVKGAMIRLAELNDFTSDDKASSPAGVARQLASATSSADKLTTARTLITNLASTAAASFDGTTNVILGATGTLPLANGGTGATSAANARTALGLDYSLSLSASGWYKLPGGLILQWGQFATANVLSYTFPLTFPSACGAVTCMQTNANSATVSRIALNGVAPSRTGFTLAALPSNTVPGRWMAIGY